MVKVKFCWRKFSRDLVTQLTVPASLIPDTSPGSDVQCFLMFTETIPSGAYVDPDQINSLKPYGGPDVLLSSPVDVEKPEIESTEFQGHVFSNLSRVGDKLTSSYRLPVHLRYHGISDQDYTTVTFTNPEVSVRCVNKKLGMPHYGYHGDIVKQKSEMCSSSSKILCDWIVIHYDAEKKDISVEVPVGKVEHYILVTVGTMVTTLSACIFLVYQTLCSGKHVKVS
ncbi:phosphatidylinositol-glycan biosynthesis class X protein-like isoform X2 [Mercenaria mercenaria]|uniref:phosphatidylinositol-glycan biosynthesis class X protein-like isoform X2 n=1 Tax=Mercenaria mercenaria TaxID=6596 RepID=UPI00234E9E2C|nr:phosphatidylinositol-glycan biosynthesis class X protein-like isoform X2 [Mercenaria mercenaria]